MHVLAVRVGHVVKVVGWVLIVDAIYRHEVLPLDAGNILHIHLEHCKDKEIPKLNQNV